LDFFKFISHDNDNSYLEIIKLVNHGLQGQTPFNRMFPGYSKIVESNRAQCFRFIEEITTNDNIQLVWGKTAIRPGRVVTWWVDYTSCLRYLFFGSGEKGYLNKFKWIPDGMINAIASVLLDPSTPLPDFMKYHRFLLSFFRNLKVSNISKIFQVARELERDYKILLEAKQLRL